MSQVNFADGAMEGDWTITDADDRKMMLVSLKAGQRNGTSTTWLPNGKVFRQITYDRATPVGDLLEVNAKTGELTKAATFNDGRKVVTKTEHHPRGRQVKSEIMYLAARSVEKAPTISGTQPSPSSPRKAKTCGTDRPNRGTRTGNSSRKVFIRTTRKPAHLPTGTKMARYQRPASIATISRKAIGFGTTKTAKSRRWASTNTGRSSATGDGGTRTAS